MVVAGEVTPAGPDDVAEIVRGVITRIGYTTPSSASTANAEIVLDRAGPPVGRHRHGCRQALDEARDRARARTTTTWLGAGDQGMMFGYAATSRPS